MRLLIALLGTTLFTLTACGGGGSGDTQSGVSLNSSVNPNVSVSYTSGNNNNNNNATLPEQQGQTMYWRDYLIYENGKAVRSTTEGFEGAETGYPQNDFTLMNLDGRKFPIPAENNSEKLIEINDKDKGTRATIGTNLSYARYGVVSYDKENMDYVFYQGYATDEKQMPKTGKFTYTGFAVGYRESDRAVSKGTSSFNVNFGERTINGTIALDKFGTHSVQATINGNEIVGNSNGINEGFFYGKNAQEMAGDFSVSHQGKYIEGNFGAKRK